MRTILLNFNFYNLIYFFAFYSFAGWCVEVLYYFKNEHKFVNRGFLTGPFCPIYGFGIVFLIVFLDGYRHNIFILFLLGSLLTTVLEYFTGFILEKTFKTKWWDYTDDPLNLHGRVCLLYSLIWGAGEVIVIRIVHPYINNIVMNIPPVLGDIFLSVIVIYFMVDFYFTLASLMQFEKIYYTFQFVQANFPFEKSGILFNSTKEKTMDKIRNFESLFSKLKLNLNNKQFNQIYKALRHKMKKD